MWLAISPKRMGTYLKRPVVNGHSLFDLLCEETIKAESVQAGLESVARAIDIESPQRQTRSAAEIAKQFGLRPPSKASSEESVAEETGL
jgi:hypothetical protein